MKKSFFNVIVFSFLFFVMSAYNLNAQNLDLSGWIVEQANATVTITLPSGTTIAPGGYVVIGRNATQSQFETFWGTTLPSNVTYINGFTVVGSNGFPTINGSETYILKNASNAIVDGPTIAQASSAGESIQRKRPNYPAGQDTSWNRLSPTSSTATPGSGATLSSSGMVVINEFSDATTFNNEFVEIYYDLEGEPTGVGTATISPDTVNHSVLTNFEITYATDATVIITDMRIIVPSNFSWSHDIADVNYTNMTTTGSVSGDTIYFNSITFN
ncbi:MAG: lamin tail domain-containing protein, partial [Ignavibacteriae bacterium]|nr:lamin tail domain-containing protein [Ignavibacteriota bacterium]